MKPWIERKHLLRDERAYEKKKRKKDTRMRIELHLVKILKQFSKFLQVLQDKYFLLIPNYMKYSIRTQL